MGCVVCREESGCEQQYAGEGESISGEQRSQQKATETRLEWALISRDTGGVHTLESRGSVSHSGAKVQHCQYAGTTGVEAVVAQRD